MNTRRKFIASVMAVVLFTLGVAVVGQSQEGRPKKKALEGSWRVTVNLGPNRPPTVPEIVEGLATYNAGGGYIFTDDQPGIQTAQGSWEFAGQRTFNATKVKFLLGPDGKLASTLHVRARITLNSTQDEYTTEEEVEIRHYPSGNLLFAYNGANGVGRRINVEPIE